MVKVQEPPVCTEPKVFLGSIPSEATSDDVTRVFGRYGTLKSVTILTMPDGRSRGCAMLLFDTWTAAEAAIEAENGTTSLGGGLGKGMVVKFADPPKRGGQDGGPVVGLVPRKLFIGQVPSGTTHDVLRSVFAPYGNIQDLHIVQKQMGAGCALLTYQKWASAEAAIEAHNGKTIMPGGTGALVVRFADAKYADGGNAYGGGMGGQKRQFGDMGMMPNKRQFGGAGGFGNPYFGMMPGMMGMMGMQGGMQGFMPPGMQNNMGAYNMMQNAAAMSSMRMGAAGSDNASGAGGGAGGAGGMQAGMGGGFGGRSFGGGFGGGMKGGPNEVAKQWKLFIGQIPYEADESDLWPLLSSYGNILELTILRNAGKSKGCGFCTYESYASAATAAQQLNNVAGIDNDPRGRKLIVKFANPSAAMTAGSQQQLQGGQATSLAGQQQAAQQAQAQAAQQAMLQQGGVGSSGAGMGGGLDSMMMMGGGGVPGGSQGGYINPAQQMGGYQQQMGGGMMMM